MRTETLPLLLAVTALAMACGNGATVLARSDQESTVEIQSGDEFEVDLEFSYTEGTISSYGVSLEFDAEGANAFDVVEVEEKLPPSLQFNLSPGPSKIVESEGDSPGLIRTCEAASMNGGGANYQSTACTVRFRSTGATGSFSMTPKWLPGDGLFSGEGMALSSAAGIQPLRVVVTQ